MIRYLGTGRTNNCQLKKKLKFGAVYNVMQVRENSENMVRMHSRLKFSN